MRIPFLDMNQARVKKFIQQILHVLSVIFLVALLLIPVVWFIWFIFFTNTFTVQAITVVDAREHTTEAVKTLLEEKMGMTIFLLQTPLLEQKILSSIPQIRDVHIVRTLPNTLKVIVQEKTPVLLLLSQKKYYFVDTAGVAYEEARLDTLPGTVLPVVKNNDEGGALTLGVPVLDQHFIDFLASIQRDLPSITGADVVEIRIPSLAAREVHFKLNNNWQIQFDITREASAQLSILRRLLDSTIAPDKKPFIEYIDLRIPQRVYYKLRTSSGTVPVKK